MHIYIPVQLFIAAQVKGANQAPIMNTTVTRHKDFTEICANKNIHVFSNLFLLLFMLSQQCLQYLLVVF